MPTLDRPSLEYVKVLLWTPGASVPPRVRARLAGHHHHDNDHDAHVDDHDDDRAGALTMPRRTPPRAARVSPVVITQVAVFPHLRLLGVVPDLGLVLAIAVA